MCEPSPQQYLSTGTPMDRSLLFHIQGDIFMVRKSLRVVRGNLRTITKFSYLTPEYRYPDCLGFWDRRNRRLDLLPDYIPHRFGCFRRTHMNSTTRFCCSHRRLGSLASCLLDRTEFILATLSRQRFHLSTETGSHSP